MARRRAADIPLPTLPARWTPLRPHPIQSRLFREEPRFAVVLKGRRSGGTEILKRKFVRKALRATTPGFRVNFCAPTLMQAVDIYWRDLIDLVPRACIVGEPHVTERRIDLISGAELRVIGMDKPHRIEGSPQDVIVGDEFQDWRPEALAATLLPCVSTPDRPGMLYLCGKPKLGKAHFKRLWDKALAGESEFVPYTWPSTDIWSAEQVALMRREMDPLLFALEIECRWVAAEGQAYYAFRRDVHAREPVADLYDPGKPLLACFDFNVSPGVAAIGQEIVLPAAWLARRPELDERVTAWIGQVHIPDNSTTRAVCRRIAADWGQRHKGDVLLYGDSTGGARGSAKENGTDWQIIQEELRRTFGTRVKLRVKRNPLERDRVNAVNARLRTADDRVHMLVDPRRAAAIADDLEAVQLLKGGSGELDKDATPEHSHMCFAAGTMVKTDRGPVAIERMPKSGSVVTWDGSLVEYRDAGRTLIDAPMVRVRLSTGEEIECTPWHQFLTTRGWRRADALSGMALAAAGSLSSLPSRRTLTASGSGGTTGRVATSAGRVGAVSSTCTASCGSTSTAGAPSGWPCITKTATAPTTSRQICTRCRPGSTGGTTMPASRTRTVPPGWPGSSRPATLRAPGTHPMPDERGTGSTRASSRVSAPFRASAPCASAPSWPTAALRFAGATARLGSGTTPAWTMSPGRAAGVACPSRPTATRGRGSAPGPARHAPARVLAVEPAGRADAFCLSVPSTGCFVLACGAIASNSDALGYYLADVHGLRRDRVLTGDF